MISQLLSLLFAVQAQASPSLGEIWRNNQAVSHLTQGKVLEANDEFVGLVGEQPFNSVYIYNLGASFISVEEFNKARKMYNQLLKAKPLPPEVEFFSNYNLGFLYSLKESADIDKALHHYQQALRFAPDSKEIKTNIELLTQQQQGGGKGSSDKKDKNKDQNDKGDEQEQEPQEFTNKPQPDQFNSKEMSKQDVKKILEELKKQEQRIRAKHDRKGKKEADREKNW